MTLNFPSLLITTRRSNSVHFNEFVIEKCYPNMYFILFEIWSCLDNVSRIILELPSSSNSEVVRGVLRLDLLLDCYRFLLIKKYIK